MKLAFTDDLHAMDIIAQGDELTQYLGMDRDSRGQRVRDRSDEDERLVATVKDPVLVTDNHRIAQLGAQSTTLRDTVFALYSTPLRTTEYDGVSLRSDAREHRGVWGPSIDTLLFCRALNKMDLSGVRTVAEIGCGSGYISAYMLRKAPNLETITLVDFNPDAIAWAGEWITDPRARFHAGDGAEFLEGKHFDMVICNPPYIPRPSSIDDNPYEGVSLLAWLIEHANEYLTPCGTHVTNISSLCQDIAERVIARSDVDATTIDSLEVPLKVYNVLNNPAWMEYLHDTRGFVSAPHDGYDFWHKISITGVRPARL